MSNVLNQKQGVYTATLNVLGDAGISFDDNQPGGLKAVMTKELRAKIIAVVTQGLVANEIDMSAEARQVYSTPEKMKGYVGGLVTNWFNKDTRFNEGQKHVTKNPGSRVGSGDDQLKALKVLRASKEGDFEATTIIDAAIKARQEEIGQGKKVELTEEMLSFIPASLRASLKI